MISRNAIFLVRFVLGHKDNYFSGKLQSSRCILSPRAPGRKESWCLTACLSLRTLLGQIRGLVSAATAWAERLWSCLFTSGCEEQIVSVCLLFFHFGIYSRRDPSLFLRWRCLSPLALKLPPLPQHFTLSSGYSYRWELHPCQGLEHGSVTARQRA